MALRGPVIQPLTLSWFHATDRFYNLNKQDVDNLFLPFGAVASRTGLRPNVAINDEIVNDYLELLGLTFTSCLFFTTYTYQTLREDLITSPALHHRTPGFQLHKYQQGLSADNITDYRYVFLPIHTPEHWSLVAIRPATHSVVFYNTLNHRLPSPTPLEDVTIWMQRMLGRRWELEGWTCQDAVDRPIQATDSNDCGPLMVLVTRLLAAHIPLPTPKSYNPRQMRLLGTTMRRRMTAELVTQRLNPREADIPAWLR